MKTPHLRRLFFLDGPGGSGKTYTYSILLHYADGHNHSPLAFATTGIASTLLHAGRTMHSGFKLPLDMTETSASHMPMKSIEAKALRDSKLIIIDAASAINRNALRCIDRLLQDLVEPTIPKDVRTPFDGKTVVLGGDFRQKLPIIPRAKRAHILDSTIKYDTRWSQFRTLSLVTNTKL